MIAASWALSIDEHISPLIFRLGFKPVNIKQYMVDWYCEYGDSDDEWFKVIDIGMLHELRAWCNARRLLREMFFETFYVHRFIKWYIYLFMTWDVNRVFIIIDFLYICIYRWLKFP